MQKAIWYFYRVNFNLIPGPTSINLPSSYETLPLIMVWVTEELKV